jgi:hypothetical protein
MCNFIQNKENLKIMIKNSSNRCGTIDMTVFYQYPKDSKIVGLSVNMNISRKVSIHRLWWYVNRSVGSYDITLSYNYMSVLCISEKNTERDRHVITSNKTLADIMSFRKDYIITLE